MWDLRVYLRDDHSQPFVKGRGNRASQGNGTGRRSEDALKIGLVPGKKKETLEAKLGSRVKFLVALAINPALPGMKPDVRREWICFEFGQFTDERGPGCCSPKGDTANTHC
jgi:hypothetical protein